MSFVPAGVLSSGADAYRAVPRKITQDTGRIHFRFWSSVNVIECTCIYTCVIRALICVALGIATYVWFLRIIRIYSSPGTLHWQS